jgi:hypothetical protein
MATRPPNAHRATLGLSRPVCQIRKPGVASATRKMLHARPSHPPSPPCEQAGLGAAMHHWQYSDATAITFRHRDSSPGRSGEGRVS